MMNYKLNIKQYMKKNYFYGIVYLLLLCSCSGNVKSTNVESSTSDEKFIGQWIVVASRGRNEALTGQENMSKGNKLSLTKTDDTYLLKGLGDIAIIKEQLAKQDENTLVGASGTQLAYIDSTEHIILSFPGEEMELMKLK